MKISMESMRFNRLLVLGQSEARNENTYWKTRCDCGQEKWIRGSALRDGTTQSCGCLIVEHYAKVKRVDLTGKVFNKLTVLEFSHNGKQREAHWKVSCSCGNNVIVAGTSLTKGVTQSCGCRIVELLKLKVGKNHPNYNSSITDIERKQRRNYPKYRIWREQVYKRDAYTCQKCGSNKGNTLVAHHILPYRAYPEFRVSTENGICWCVSCHKIYHSKYSIKNVNRETFNEFMAT